MIGKKFLAVLTLLSLTFLCVSSAGPAMAIYPDQVPLGGSANVNDNLNEWGANVLTDPTANQYYFTPLYEAGKTNKPILGYAFLKYESSTGVLYALVIIKPDITSYVVNPDGPHWIKTPYVGGTNNEDVGDSSGDDSTPPDFALVYADDKLIGYEASLFLGYKPITTTIAIHLQVISVNSEGIPTGQTTSGTGAEGVPLVIPPDFVVPEYALGGLMAIGAFAAAFIVFKGLPRSRKK